MKTKPTTGRYESKVNWTTRNHAAAVARRQGQWRRRVAKEIATELFQNGAGGAANRLVLELPNKRNGGGWCKQAVIDVITVGLKEFPPP